MKILLAQRTLLSTYGGAERSLITLGKYLSGRGHVVSALGEDGRGARKQEWPQVSGIVPIRCTLRRFAGKGIKWPDLWTWAWQWRRCCARALGNTGSELALTQLDMAPSTIEAARELSVPSVLFVRSFEHLCPREFQEGLDACGGSCWKCLPPFERYQYPWMLLVMRSHSRALRDADMVISNSDFTRRLLLDRAGVESDVVHPFIELATTGDPTAAAGGGPALESGSVARRPAGQEILMVTPRLAKGVRTVLEVARRLPRMRFLLVGELDASLSERDLPANVSHVGPVSDMGPLYARAGALLVPSIWPEPFGRVVIEAGALGVPSVVSAVGGLPEALGKGGVAVSDYKNPKAFEKGLNEVLEGREDYSRLALANARRFAASDPAGRFVKLLKARLGLDL